MFSKVLIANRGEIACRIIRSAKKCGIKTVAVYSDADKNALHVKLADEAVHIGPSPALQSYLNIDAIIAAAKKHEATAIHPGYGFLSENADFSAACQKNGILFIGPSADSMQKMADKGAAKKLMQHAGVPVIPGGDEPSRDSTRLQAQAEKLGFPILLKACAGGGGKGMRAVTNSKDFMEACASAQREAMKSFGDDTLIVEKFFPRAKHIEVQIFGDNHGHCVYLFERDCSVQRRYQKIIEEAPAPNLPESIREAMGKTAVAAAKSINYSGAGTIEFLVTPDNQFYFMEMNTRLQVEHPITECITGLDLVQWQFMVANDEHLPLSQNEIKLAGHAFEARLYAEDPNNNFLPTIGKIRALQWPAEGIRIDTGIVAGDEISVFYDPMIAKIIVWRETRDQALAAMRQALSETNLLGLTTNLGFLKAILDLPIIEKGEQYTAFIQETGIDHHLLKEEIFIAIAAAYSWKKLEEGQQSNNPWTFIEAWRVNLPQQFNLTFNSADETYRAIFESYKDKQLQFSIEKIENRLSQGERSTAKRSGEGLPLKKQKSIEAAQVHFQAEIIKNNDDQFRVIINNEKYACLIEQDNAHLYVAVHGQQMNLTLDHLLTESRHNIEEDLSNLRSPMPGTVISLSVKKGDNVKAGDILLIIEAMKMEHTIRAPADGAIKSVYFNEGDFVSEGVELVEFE